MKILMVPEKDSANFSLTHIERAFSKNGHIVDIYAPYYAENVLRMFDDKVNKKSFDELTYDKVEEYDIIFASVFSLWALRDRHLLNVKKYIFTYDFLIHGELIHGGDFNFAPSLNNTSSIYQKEFRFPKVGIGEPKFDSLKISQVESNKLLFIDSGHYPFGELGKKVLAKLLLDICVKFPDYELCIKPRFLPSDQIVTHKNATHLYDAIRQEANGTLPANMNLLMEHVELEELINKSRTVLCMYTTAYISALVADKGLIIIDQLPNEDTYDIREKRFLQTRDGMVGTNALINYKEVLNFLPDGIKSPKEFLNHEILYTENVADKIVNVTEFIYNEYISKGQFPDINWTEYENFKNNITVRPGATWEDIISDRFENSLKHSLLIKFDFRVKAKIELSSIINFVESLKNNGRISEENFYKAINNVNKIVWETEIENHDQMAMDEIDYGLLIEAYYQLKRYEKIKELENQNCGAYEFFRGKVALEENDIDLAKELLEKYVNRTSKRKFVKEVSDLTHYKSFAYFFLGKLYTEEKNIEKANYFIQLYEEITPNSEQVAKHLTSSMAREQAYNELYRKWIKAARDHKMEDTIKKLDEKIMVYGAGSITENLVMTSEFLRQKIALLVDEYCNEETKFNVQVIKTEEIKNYNEINTILVTVPHVFEIVKENIRKIRSDIKIISITELLD